MNDIHNTLGLRVLQVAPNSPAAMAGIREKDVIVAIAGQVINTFQDYADVTSKYPMPYIVELIRNQREFLTLEVKSC